MIIHTYIHTAYKLCPPVYAVPPTQPSRHPPVGGVTEFSRSAATFSNSFEVLRLAAEEHEQGDAFVEGQREP